MARKRSAARLFVGLAGIAFACGDPPAEEYTPDPRLIGPATPSPVVLDDGGVATVIKGRSCGGTVGADTHCGSNPNDETAPGSQDCCEVKALPGGTFRRFNDAAFPATISPFALDTFELTAGRFRTWVEATNGDLRGSAPPPGGGAHPKIAGSGWRAEWNQFLPSTRAEVDRMLGPEETASGFPACQYGTNIDDSGALTWWTDTLENRVRERNRSKPGIIAENTRDALERKPLNCIPWEVMFAFCVWDGGRLPTDAEFSFAMSAGDEQRPFPWGTLDPSTLVRFANRNDLSLVPIFDPGGQYITARLYDKTLGPNVFEDNYSFTYGGKTMAKTDNAAHIPSVGKKPRGNGKWGHADLAGGMFEWMLDEGPVRPGPCTDCANVNWPASDGRDPEAPSPPPEEFFKDRTTDWYKGGMRVIRGSAWDNSAGLANTQTRSEVDFYTSYPIRRTYRAVGGRCARDF